MQGLRLGRPWLESEHEVASNAITMSADDTLVAWLDEDLPGHRAGERRAGADHVRQRRTDAGGVTQQPRRGAAAPDARPRVHGAGRGLRHHHDQVTVRSAASIDLRTSEPLRIEDVSPDGEQWAVTFPPTVRASSSGARASTSPPPKRDRAPVRHHLLLFSPDGTHLTAARGDNSMWGSVEVINGARASTRS